MLSGTDSVILCAEGADRRQAVSNYCECYFYL